ncbi:hypothetical protein LUZ60_004889 [Juncus effusus]|nr:hypothetical protein LUZ60_004889 [Juncus effusus]
MANTGQERPSGGATSSSTATAATTSTGRPPRLPRWTRQEILVLIEGKRVVERRGRGRVGPGLGPVTPVEPKWAAVSAYCKRHGVTRGPVQCRKRWSNLAGDYKKIKEWERGEKNESFWVMRNDLRRENRLPGFFDREVFDIIDNSATGSATGRAEVEEEEEEEKEEEEKERDVGEEEKVFDSGRKDGGLFEDDVEDEMTEKREGENLETPTVVPPVAAVPISEKGFESPQPHHSEPGSSREKRPAPYNLSTDLPSHEGHKRQRTSEEERDESANQTHELIQLLERNSRLVAAQLEAQNINSQLDRDERKNQTDSLLGVLNKLADSLGKIADKL